MHVEPIEGDAGIEAALDLQRGLSMAETAEDLLFEFARRFHELSGATHLMSLEVQGLEPGEYRVRDAVDVSVPTVTREHALANFRWNEDDHNVEIRSEDSLSELLYGGQLKTFRGLDAADDPVVGPFLGTMKDGVAIPIFVGGSIAEWAVIFFDPGYEFNIDRLRVGLSNINLFARGAMQLELHRQVTTLTDRLTKEMEEIGRVQRSLLPELNAVPTSLEIDVRYQPCEAAGGDYYDFRRFDNDRVGVVVADVSGHGPVAAVAMAMLRTAMHTHRMFENGKENIAEDINRVMLEGLRDGMFVTAVFVGIDERTGEMEYYNCGHCYPLIRRASGEIDSLEEGHGPPLGVLDDLEITVGRATLHPGDSLVLLTDGIVETFSPDNQLFGDDRLRETIAKATADPTGMLWSLLEAVDEHAAGGPRRDDQCVVVIKRPG